MLLWNKTCAIATFKPAYPYGLIGGSDGLKYFAEQIDCSRFGKHRFSIQTLVMGTFDQIKFYLEKYRQSSLVSKTLQALSRVQQKGDKTYPVWTLITMLKWIYTHSSETNLKRPVDDRRFDELLILTDAYEREFNGLNFKTPSSRIKSFKIKAFQQFPLQEEFYRVSIDRQLVLYLKLSTSFPLEEKFRAKAGISLKEFFNLCFYTYCYINAAKLGGPNSYDGILHQDYFDIMADIGIADKTHLFLKLISANSSEEFKGLHRLGDQQLQLFETAFLTTKPFLYFRGQYRLPYRNIFDLTLAYFVYNFMKAAYPDTFPDEFGKRLERYLELGLKESKELYLNESMLKKKYNLSKVTDYMVGDDILIECKAIELHPRSGILRKEDILRNELKTSVIKAYCQLLSVAKDIDPNRDWFGVIITYKETYLGFGKDCWDEFIKEPIEAYAHAHRISIDILPPENLIFVPVACWDRTIQLVKDGKFTFREILQNAKEMSLSENIAEQVILYETVLGKLAKAGKIELGYLDEAHELIDLELLNDPQ